MSSYLTTMRALQTLGKWKLWAQGGRNTSNVSAGPAVTTFAHLSWGQINPQNVCRRLPTLLDCQFCQFGHRESFNVPRPLWLWRPLDPGEVQPSEPFHRAMHLGAAWLAGAPQGVDTPVP